MPGTDVARVRLARRYMVLATAHATSESTVYRCRERLPNREVAVKSAAGGAAAARRRLLTDARLRGRFEHAHILPVLRVVQGREGTLVVSPWLAGGTLEQRLDAGPLAPGEVLALANGIGSALDALHASGWWHGDVSARNVLYGADGRSVLADFGTARRHGRTAVEGDLMTLTPAAASPEVCAGWPGDGRSDLYSLGVLLYAALAGTYPFDPADAQRTMEQHRLSPVPPCPGAGRAVNDLLQHVLAKEPATRPRNGAELAEALAGAFHTDGIEVSATAAAPAGSAVDLAEAITSAGRQLDGFAATLDERGQVALGMLLQQARLAGTRALAEAGGLLMQVHGPVAALLALEASGAARALARGSLPAAELAVRSGLDAGRLERLLLLLFAAGFVGRDGDRFLLPDALAAAYAAGELDLRARLVQAPAATWWSGLTSWLRTGRPATLVDSDDGAGYRDLAPALAAMNERPATLLAQALHGRGLLPPAARVLDVGAGAAVWSVALAEQDAGVRVTALDRPLVLETAAAYAAGKGVGGRLTLLAGDWRTAPLAAQAFDLAIVANVCHLHGADEVLTLFRRLRAAVRAGGTLVVVDTIPESVTSAPIGIHLQSLDLALRTPNGGVHDAAAYRGWLLAAGFEPGDLLELDARHASMLAV